MRTVQKHQKRMEYKRLRRKAHNKGIRMAEALASYARRHPAKSREVNKAGFDAIMAYFINKHMEKKMNPEGLDFNAKPEES